MVWECYCYASPEPELLCIFFLYIFIHISANTNPFGTEDIFTDDSRISETSKLDVQIEPFSL